MSSFGNIIFFATLLSCVVVAPVADIADFVYYQLFLAEKHPELSFLARNLQFSMTDTLEYLTTPAGAILTVLGIGPSILLLVLLAPRSLRRNSQEGFEKKDGRWLRASPLVVNGSKPVRLLYREESRENGDSGWRVLSGDEAEDFLKDPTRLKRLQLDDFLRREPAVRALLDEPAGTAFLRDEGSATFRRVRSVAARLIDG